MDAFTAALALIVGAVLLFVVKAVRQTRGRGGRDLRGTDPRRREDIARDLAAHMREQADRVRCVRCGGPTFMLPGTGAGYKCEVCRFTFEGPAHTPDTGP